MEKEKKPEKTPELKNKNICIVSKQEIPKEKLPQAKEVKDDIVIRTIRQIKQRLGVASNNKLYVSMENMEEYKKRRSSFEKSLVITLILSVLIFLGMGIVPIITTGNVNFGSMFLGLLVGILLILLSGFVKYVPSIKV